MQKICLLIINKNVEEKNLKSVVNKLSANAGYAFFFSFGNETHGEGKKREINESNEKKFNAIPQLPEIKNSPRAEKLI